MFFSTFFSEGLLVDFFWAIRKRQKFLGNSFAGFKVEQGILSSGQVNFSPSFLALSMS
jgi:hypothetical protein